VYGPKEKKTIFMEIWQKNVNEEKDEKERRKQIKIAHLINLCDQCPQDTRVRS
jgi:hypothetical protein